MCSRGGVHTGHEVTGMLTLAKTMLYLDTQMSLLSESLRPFYRRWQSCRALQGVAAVCW